jgi:hypothetical protein
MGRRFELIDPRELRLLAVQGLTMADMARVLGVTYMTVYRSVQIAQVQASLGRSKLRTPPPVIPSRCERLLPKIRELADQGLNIGAIAAACGVDRQTLKKWAAKHDVPVKKWARLTTATNLQRAEKMATMHRQGVTLAKIGETFGVTRERVRVILKCQGITRSDGGKSVSAHSRREAHASAVNARSLIKYGVSREEVKKAHSNGLIQAYRYQKNNAAARGVEWGLSFAQWLQVWTLSGKIDQRGRGKGKYCMSRIKDTGGYVMGNVHIQLNDENGREAVAKWKGKSKSVRGVFLLYPGLSKPYLAKVGKKALGYFASEEDAVQARCDFAAANGYQLMSSGQMRKAS